MRKVNILRLLEQSVHLNIYFNQVRVVGMLESNYWIWDYTVMTGCLSVSTVGRGYTVHTIQPIKLYS